MKKVVLFTLLLTAAAAAHAIHHQPMWGVSYHCYYDNYYGNALDPGRSTWVKTAPDSQPGGPGTLLIRTHETFTVPYWPGTDTYKASWANPRTKFPHPENSTVWEFTFTPHGPQCKNTTVSPDSSYIIFQECTDGHTRTCTLY